MEIYDQLITDKTIIDLSITQNGDHSGIIKQILELYLK